MQNLECVKDGFYTLDLKDNELNISKIEVIKEIAKVTKFNSINANLAKFNCSIKFTDRIGRNSKLNIKNGILINQSVTGLWSRKYEF